MARGVSPADVTSFRACRQPCDDQIIFLFLALRDGWRPIIRQSNEYMISYFTSHNHFLSQTGNVAGDYIADGNTARRLGSLFTSHSVSFY